MRNGDVRLRPLTLPDDVTVALPWYQDPEVLRFSEGDAREPYSANTVRAMYECLAATGEVYIIEVEVTPGEWTAIGDATLSRTGLPIAIGDAAYRSRGYGTRVLSLLVERARFLGWERLVTNGIAPSNLRSIHLFERAGFARIAQRAGDGHPENTVRLAKTLVVSE